MQAKLKHWVDLREGEGRLFMLMALHAVLFGSGTSFIFTSATAIFLAQFDNITLLWSYVAMAAVAMVLSAVLTFIQKHLSSGVLFRFLVATVAVVSFGFWAGLSFAPTPWLVFLVIVWYQIEYNFTRIEWLGLRGEVLTIQQGKRMLGPLGSIEMIGKVISFIAMPILLTVLQTRDLLLLGAIVFVAIYILLEMILRLTPQSGTVDNAAHEPKLETKSSRQGWRSDNYLLTILLSFGLLVMLQMTLTFGVYSGIQLRFPSEAQVASFISGYYLAVYGAVFLIGPLTQRLLRQFGLGFSFSILPTTVAIACIISVGLGFVLGLESLAFFIAIVVAFAFFDVLNTSFINTSLVLLLQVMPSETQVRAKIGSETIATPLAIGLTGLLLLFLERYQLTNPLIAFAISAVFSVLMYVIARFVLHHYQQVLENNFDTLPFSGQELDLDNANVISYLRAKLHSPYPLEVEAAVNMLMKSQSAPSRNDLRRLLDHENPRIRAVGVNAIGQVNYVDMIDEVRDAAQNDPDTQVLIAGFNTMCRLDAPEAVHLVGNFLTDADPTICQGAMLALLKHGGLSGIQKAGVQLLDYVKSDDTSQRLMVVEAVSEAGVHAYSRSIFPELIHDADPTVRRAALLAVGKLNATKYIPDLLDALTDGKFAGTAGKSLQLFGEAAIQPTKDMLVDPLTPDYIKYRLIKVLGAINTLEANQYLYDQLADADVDLRRNIYAALVRHRYQVASNDDTLRAALAQYQTEMRIGAFLFGTRRALNTADQPNTALLDALDQAINDICGHMTRLIGIFNSADIVLPAQRSLQLGNSTQQAVAIELFETLVPSIYRKHTNLLLDPQLSEAERWSKLKIDFPEFEWASEQEALQQLIQAPDTWVNAWVKACALNAISTHMLPTLEPALDTASFSSDPLIQGTALHVKLQLKPDLAS